MTRLLLAGSALLYAMIPLSAEEIKPDEHPTDKITVDCGREVLSIQSPSKRWDRTEFRCDKDGGVWIYKQPS